MIGRWIRRLLQREPSTKAVAKGKKVPLEPLDHAALPLRCGPYLLLEYLGTGTLGEIYIGRQAEGEKLLMIRRGLVRVDSSTYLQMRLDELRTYTRLDHPQICAMIEARECEGAPMIVSEYTPGKSVLHLLMHCRGEQRSLPWKLAAFVGHEVCGILEYLHQKGDTHGCWNIVLGKGGFSPADILIDFSGQVRLANIGLRSLSRNQEMFVDWCILDHTPFYLSPEGVVAKALEQRADSFGVGWLLWELVTGERLFAGDNDFQTLTNIRDVVMRPPTELDAEVPPELEAIIVKALCKDPAERPYAGEMKRDLAAITDLEGAQRDLAAMINEVFATDRDQAREEMRRWTESRATDDQ